MMCEESSCPCPVVLPPEVEDLLRDYPVLSDSFRVVARSSFIHALHAAAAMLRLGAAEYRRAPSRPLAEMGSKILLIESGVLEAKADEIAELPLSMFRHEPDC